MLKKLVFLFLVVLVGATAFGQRFGDPNPNPLSPVGTVVVHVFQTPGWLKLLATHPVQAVEVTLPNRLPGSRLDQAALAANLVPETEPVAATNPPDKMLLGRSAPEVADVESLVLAQDAADAVAHLHQRCSVQLAEGNGMK